MSAREVTSHQSNPCNRAIQIVRWDDRGPGGANRVYRVTTPSEVIDLKFQNGPVSQSGEGANGLTNEALLAIVADRLYGFASGPFGCRENEIALQKVEEAMLWLQRRTNDRIARGVEGTHAN